VAQVLFVLAQFNPRDAAALEAGLLRKRADSQRKRGVVRDDGTGGRLGHGICKYRIAAMSALLPLYDNVALRRAEARAALRLGDDSVLMQRAGLAAWRCALAHWPQAHRILLAGGPGNTGGDGRLLGRLVREVARRVRGRPVRGHAPRGEVANRAERAYREAGGLVEGFSGSIGGVDLVVDTL